MSFRQFSSEAKTIKPEIRYVNADKDKVNIFADNRKKNRSLPLNK
jgi:hypothetical protein